MKKIIISSILCFALIMPALAQDAEGKADPTVNKRGISLLPQAGDFAIGIDGTPFLNYLGNFFNQAGSNTAPYANGVDNTIYAKYFLENDRAIRAKIHLNFTQEKHKQTIQDDYTLIVDPTNVSATTIDTWKTAENSVDINLGYEFRRGRGRVQGFYGGQVMLGYGKFNEAFDYGNSITQSNQNPTTHDFGANTAVPQGYRLLESKGGATFGVGVGGFVGVEYFFAPQISIGGEFSLNFNYYTRTQDKLKSEGFLGNGIQEYEYRARNASDNAFSAGIQTVPQGAIFLMFHF